jgi:hypothetical protein
MRKPVPATGWRRPLEVFGEGLMFVLKPLQIVSNFVFLSLAYFVGVGLSALLYRIGPGKRKASDPSTSSGTGSYWCELPPAPRDKDSWLRPF